MRKINLIVVHGSFTPPTMDIGVETIRDWHVGQNGWDDIGYHAVIKRSGILELGRPEEKAGAHAYKVNSNSLGVCLIGGKSAGGEHPEANYTLEQYLALDHYLIAMIKKYGPCEIVGHYEVDDKGKTCPGFDVTAWANGRYSNG